MSYLWHLDGLSMALGIGELDGCTRSWNTKCHSIFFLNTNNSNNTNVFLHTDLTHGFFALDVWTRDFFWTRIIRKRIIFGTRLSFFKHTALTDLTHGFWALDVWTRDFFLNTNFTNKTNVFWHTDLTLTDLEPSARCEWQLVTVIGSLWLLTHCGYWLVVVIDLLCFKWQIKKDIREPCEALADPWDLWDPCAK